jgi:hypothetical protein
MVNGYFYPGMFNMLAYAFDPFSNIIRVSTVRIASWLSVWIAYLIKLSFFSGSDAYSTYYFPEILPICRGESLHLIYFFHT